MALRDRSKEHQSDADTREKFVHALQKNNTEKSLDHNKDLGTKVDFLKGVYKKDSEKNKHQNQGSDQLSVDELINGMPSELIDLINDEIEFCLAKDCDPQEVTVRVKKLIDTLYLAYKDQRKYLDMYGRNYQELLLSDFISEICESDYTETDWHRIARINFNLNGLRTVNMFGVEGRASGNKLLEIFANILKSGKTVSTLESLGITVVPSAEGTDNFGLVLYGPYDLRLILGIAEELLIREAEEADVKGLLEFTNPEIVEVFKRAGIELEQKPVFRIMASVGSATLGEVLDEIQVPEGTDYAEVSRILLNSMFRIADMRARKFKEAFKAKLKQENNYLYHLYARSNIEMLEERVEELEQQVSSSHK